MQLAEQFGAYGVVALRPIQLQHRDTSRRLGAKYGVRPCARHDSPPSPLSSPRSDAPINGLYRSVDLWRKGVWQDVDFDRASLSVRQTGNIVGGVWTVEAPKGRKDGSATSRRLSLDAGTVEALRRHRTLQLQERMAWDGDRQDHGSAFVRDDGSPLDPSTIGQQLTVRARLAELPTSGCTTCGTPTPARTRGGVHPRSVSERPGHANIGITLNLYSHVGQGMERDADRVAGLFT